MNRSYGSRPAGQQEPLWLDRHLRARLASRFPHMPGVKHAGQAEQKDGSSLTSWLRLWQWERLCSSLLRAGENSLHYAGDPGLAHLRLLLEEAAITAGLAEKASCIPTGDIPYASLTGQGQPNRYSFESALSLVLSRLPFTLPDQLAVAPDSFLAVSHSDVSGVISLPTSGTTGAGKRIYCSESDLEQTADFFRHGMQYMVLPERGDHVALLMSGERPGSVGDLLLRGMQKLGVRCSVPGFVPLSPEGEDAMMDRLINLSPTCLVGVPGQLLVLARHSKAPLLAKSLRYVLLSGDAVTGSTRSAIADGLDCEVFVHYGLTETGLGGAVECREHAGCHMREADLIHEIVDESGIAVPAGEYGEIVITTLTREAMPLIRYRTGDEGRIFEAPCSCGSALGRLEVRGRMSERVPLPCGGCLHITDLDRILYALPSVRGYSAVLHGNGPGACLVLGLRFRRDASSQDVSSGSLAEAEQALSRLQGIQVSGKPADLRQNGALPVLVREEKDALPDSDDALHRRQAKQSILRTDKPMEGVLPLQTSP